MNSCISKTHIISNQITIYRKSGGEDQEYLWHIQSEKNIQLYLLSKLQKSVIYGVRME